MENRRRLRKVAQRAGIVLALASIFVCSFVVGIALHLPLPPSKRLATHALSSTISKGIRGSIEVDRFDRLSLAGFAARDVVIRDPDGAVVLAAPRIRARANMLGMAASALFGSGPIELRFSFVRVDQVDVNLLQDEAGSVTLAQTFLPPEKPPPAVPTVPSKPSRAVVVDLPAIEVGTIRVRGELRGVPPIDADAQGITGSVYAGPGEVRVDTSPFPVVARHTLPEVLGTTLDFHFRTPSLLWSDFVASFGEILFSGKAKLDGKYLDAAVDVPHTTTDALRAYLPDLKPGEPVEAHLEWHGALSQLATVARLQVGDGTMEARGTLAASDTGTSFNVGMRHVNLALLAPTLPTTDLGLDARVQLGLSGGKPTSAMVSGTVPATTLQGVDIPDSNIECTVDSGGVRGTAWLHEPGMPIEAKFAVTRQGDVSLKASAMILSLADAPRLQKQLEGSAVANLDASWSGGRLDATLVADLTHARRGNVSLGIGRLTTHAWGQPDALEVDASVVGSQLDLGGFRWAQVSARLRGPVDAPRAVVTLGDDVMPHVVASAGVSWQNGGGLRGVSVVIKRSGETVEASTPSVRFGRNLELGKVTIEGLGGTFETAARVGKDGVKIKATADGVRLERVAGLFGLPVSSIRGEARVSVDLESRGAETSGCIAIDFRRAMIYAPDIDTSFRAQFAGKHASAALNVSVAGTQDATENVDGGACLPARNVRSQAPLEASATAELDLAGPITSPSAWTGATGVIQVPKAAVNFSHAGMNMLLGLAESVGGVKLPTMTGEISVHAEAKREAGEPLPSWLVNTQTRGLSVQVPGQDAPRTVEGADLFASLSMTPSGHVSASACIRDDGGASDSAPCDPNEQNVLITLRGVADVDYAGLLERRAQWRMLLATAKLDLRLAVPERSFPDLVRPIPWASSLPFTARKAAGSLRLQGSVAQPRIDYVLQLLDATPLDSDWRASETLCALGAYDGARAGLFAEVLHRVGELPKDKTLDNLCRDPKWRAASSGSSAVFHPVGNVTANVDVDWSLALRSTSLSQVPWVADVVASLHDIDLGELPVMVDNGVEGKLSVTGGIRNLGLNPDFGVQVEVDGLEVGASSKYDKAVLVLRTDERGMRGTVELKREDAQHKLRTQLTAGLDTRQVQWSEGLSPRFSANEPVDVWMEADGFDAAVLAPLVSPALSYIEGQINGSVYATWSPKPGESAVHMADLTLTKGAFEVPVLGQEFTGATTHIRATKRDQLSIDNLVARAPIGAIAANAKVDLTNLVPTHIAAAIASDRNNRLRVTYEGIPLGDFDGAVYANVYLGKTRNDALIEIDNAHLELSESELRNVQQTTPNADITMVPPVVTGAGRVVTAIKVGNAWKEWSRARPPTPSSIPWYVRFVTRSPVTVSRSDLTVSVSSPDDTSQAPLLIYPDESGQARMEGHIQLADGRLNVVGKTFEIEPGQGRVIFDGDPGTPLVNLTTRWDAPDGTRVVADVTGPLNNPTIRFRSVPARPAAEILSMILTGTTGTETASASPSSSKTSDTSAAAGVGGGVATVGINRLLQDVSPISVSTRVDTSEAQNVRPTIAVQVARNVTAETTVNTGALAPGQTQDVYMLTLDWRFLREWSMRTTVGNKGSSVFDVVWQHRY